MVDLKGKAKEISAEKESLQRSLDAALLPEKDFEKVVSELTDEVVSTSNVYLECTKEKALFLYPNMDLSPLDFLKVVRSGELVDEEAMVFPKLGNLTSLESCQSEGEVNEGGESGDPQLESVVMKEIH